MVAMVAVIVAVIIRISTLSLPFDIRDNRASGSIAQGKGHTVSCLWKVDELLSCSRLEFSSSCSTQAELSVSMKKSSCCAYRQPDKHVCQIFKA